MLLSDELFFDLNRKYFAWLKQNLARSKLIGSVFKRKIQFCSRISCFCWLERRLVDTTSWHPWRSKISSSGPGPRVLSHWLFLSSSFLSPQTCVQSRNGWPQFSHIVGSLELVYQKWQLWGMPVTLALLSNDWLSNFPNRKRRLSWRVELSWHKLQFGTKTRKLSNWNTILWGFLSIPVLNRGC